MAGTNATVWGPAVLRGTVTAPGSKSYTHRALAAAALYGGDVVIENASDSDACAAMAAACSRFGARVDRAGGGAAGAAGAGGLVLRVRGLGGRPPAPCRADVGNSGTALRIAVAMAALSLGTATVTGDASLRSRPTGALVGALRALGGAADGVQRADARGRPEVYAPITAGGGLAGGAAEVVAGESSQHVSALLIVANSAAADTEITIRGPLASRPYVEMTVEVLAAFGIAVDADLAAGRLFVRHGQRPAPPARYAVPGDYSQAAFFLAAACLTDSDVTVRGLDPGDRQGDKAVVGLLRRMGAEICEGPGGDLRVRGPFRLEGIDADLSATPDLFPVMAVVGAHAEGPTRLHNMPQIRTKETDRIAVVERELGRHGIPTESGPDEMTVHGGRRRPPAAAAAAAAARGGGAGSPEYDFGADGGMGVSDHRVAMALSLAGLAGRGAVIRDAGSVSISYPSYFGELRRLGAVVEVQGGPARSA